MASHNEKAQDPFATPPLSRVTSAVPVAPALAADGPTTKAKRMVSTAIHFAPEDKPYSAVPKPWTEKPPTRARVSYVLTWALLFIGAGLGSMQSYMSWRNVRLDRQPMCLIFEEEFDEGSEATVWGTPGSPGKFLREVQMDGFGNGQFEMTTGSSNNSFLQNGYLYLLPSLTEGYPFPDGTTYNSTDCTFNITQPNGGFTVPNPGGAPTFDWDGYYTACSRTTNSSAGTIINPVQSARVSTLLSARGNESTLSRGSLRYGKVEVRAKMPQGDWLWPAIWMLPVDNVYGAWPRSGEIDIVESRGNGLQYTAHGANYVQGALNWGPNPAFNGVSKSYSWWAEKRQLFSSGFHTYTMEWTEQWIRFSVDTRLHTLLDLKFDQPFWKRGQFPAVGPGPDGNPEPLTDPWVNATNNAAPFDQDFYLIMNVAVGGTNGWFPDGQGNKPWLNHAGNPIVDFVNNMGQWLPTWPQSYRDRAMVVDYVRMWKHCGDP